MFFKAPLTLTRLFNEIMRKNFDIIETRVCRVYSPVCLLPWNFCQLYPCPFMAVVLSTLQMVSSPHAFADFLQRVYQ